MHIDSLGVPKQCLPLCLIISSERVLNVIFFTALMDQNTCIVFFQFYCDHAWKSISDS